MSKGHLTLLAIVELNIWFGLVYLFLAVLDLCCCVQVSLIAGSWDYCLVLVHRLLIVVASLIVKHRLQGFSSCGAWA